MVSAMFAAAIAVATPQAVAPAALPAEDASPAMFVVRDADTTVYIFGTFHALDGRSEWFRDRVRAAFGGAPPALATVRKRAPKVITPAPSTAPAAQSSRSKL